VRPECWDRVAMYKHNHVFARKTHKCLRTHHISAHMHKTVTPPQRHKNTYTRAHTLTHSHANAGRCTRQANLSPRRPKWVWWVFDIGGEQECVLEQRRDIVSSRSANVGCVLFYKIAVIVYTWPVNWEQRTWHDGRVLHLLYLFRLLLVTVH
jgi:hypothetical protein